MCQPCANPTRARVVKLLTIRLPDGVKNVPPRVSYSRPIFMRFRHFDFETAIRDGLFTAELKSQHPQGDVAAIEPFLALLGFESTANHIYGTGFARLL